MKTAKEKMWERMRTPRVMTSISLRIAEDVVNDLKEIAPMLGFSGYQSLIKAYISHGLRHDLERLEGSNIAVLTESLRKRGVKDEDISAAIEEAGLGSNRRKLVESFVENLQSAIAERDRAMMARLIEAIPARVWDVQPGCATADYMGVQIQVDYLDGGSGINTYESVSVLVTWSDENSVPLGPFGADELKLPNYIAPEKRLHLSATA